MKANKSLMVVGVVVGGVLTVSLAQAQDQGSLRERIRERLAERQQGSVSVKARSDVTAKIEGAGDFTFSFEHDGIARTYRIHVPPQYDPGKATPLIVSMHGGGGSMDYQASDENYGQISKSNREGFIVVFPNGFSRFPGGRLATWNAGNCCGPARDRNVDDVGFIRQMVSNLTKQLNIDSSKVYATGMSNGGLMAHRLACEMSDVFKAIASVAGTDNTKVCSPTNPVSILEIHATNDDHLPFNGGMGKKSMGSAATNFTSVPESISRWVKRDGCSPQPKRVLEKPGAYCDSYSQCTADAKVDLCVTELGGHSWPGASRTRGDPASRAISANDVMWDFFNSR